jgi:hypothetical protein
MPASAINGIDSGTLAVPVDDARLRWSLSAAISGKRRPTAATNALLGALTRAAGPRDQPGRDR